MKTFIASLSLLAVTVTVTACDDATELESSGAFGDDWSQRAADEQDDAAYANPSPALAEAMLVVDIAVEALTTTPDSEIPWAMGHARDMMDYVGFEDLSEDDQKALHHYVRSYADDLQPVLISMSNAGVPIGNIDGFGDFGDPIIPPGQCASRCSFLFESGCEGGFIGMCIGFWGCDAGIGLHECNMAGVEPPTNCGGDVCGAGERCARWIFKPHECVQTCEDDGDCAEGFDCERPAGTLFKRCR